MSTPSSPTVIFESHSAAETYAWGRSIGAAARSGDVIVLVGELGCGKTVLAQGIGAGLGISGPIPSPTFIICHEYESGRGPLFHFDLYRIGGAAELDDLGFYEYLERGVCLIEWAERADGELPPGHLRITMEKNGETHENNCHRLIRFGRVGGHRP